MNKLNESASSGIFTSSVFVKCDFVAIKDYFFLPRYLNLLLDEYSHFIDAPGEAFLNV